MRSINACIAAVLLAVPLASAQAQQVTLGARGGVNVANADAQGSLFSQDVGTTGAFHFGVLASVEITRILGLQTNVLYSRKGFAEGDGSVELGVDYIEIPVLATLTLPSRLAPHLYLGVFLALESRCRVSTATVTDEDCSEAVDAPRTRGADSGLMLGGGVTWDVGFSSLLLDLLYQHGFTDISELSDDVDSIKTRTVYLSAGLTFPLGRRRQE